MDIRQLRPSPAMIVALLALVVSMSAGAYAAVVLPKNSVVSKTIKNGEVKTKDIKSGAVKAKSLAASSVDSSKVLDGSVGSADLSSSLRSDLNDASTVGGLSVADLNDASTVGGLSVAQIVAAAGGKYTEARQAAGSVDIESQALQDLVTLNLPAGKYLINAKVPVQCSYDGSGGATPANPAPMQPFFGADGVLKVGGATVDTVNATCEAEARSDSFFLGDPFFYGTSVVEITRQITVAAPTTVVLQASGTIDGFLGGGLVAERINASASNSIIQAITVQ